MARARTNDLELVMTEDPRGRADLASRAAEHVASLQKRTELYATLISEPREKELYPEIVRNLSDYKAAHERVLALIAQDNRDAATEVVKSQLTPIFRKTVAQLTKLQEVNRKGAEISNKSADVIYTQARITIAAMIVTCVVLAMLLSWWVARLVARPLSNAVKIARQVAEGDLTATIPNNAGRDETGQLMDALKQMNDNLLKIVHEVRTSTDTISTASAEIATGNMDLSSRTEQQAGALEETASAMEELTSTVKQNSDNARQAKQLAIKASEIAQSGGDVVGKVVDTMGDINNSSRKIVDIIAVIDGIAFQTNILALNAAVEAARAGEQGRGFAVVASEVRTLAQRSTAAAREIKTLIDDSVSKVDTGTQLVGEAGQTMSEVMVSVKRVSDVVAEITAASAEQSQGIEQINNAVVQMDENTQQNAALVEQAAAAAKALQEQAGRLSQSVGVFRLDASYSPAPVVQASQVHKMERDITPPRLTVSATRSRPLAQPKTAPSIAASSNHDSTNNSEWEQF